MMCKDSHGKLEIPRETEMLSSHFRAIKSRLIDCKLLQLKFRIEADMRNALEARFSYKNLLIANFVSFFAASLKRSTKVKTKRIEEVST